jgi:DNA-binding LacI/PurR family transcriptional regulator
MADVAKLAGVSNQTVSRVANDGDYVAPETRERVLAAMRMLNYRPNSAARALRTARSRTIGVVSFDTTFYGPASALAAIERETHSKDYFTSIVTLQSLDRESLSSAVQRLQRQGVDGILVIAPLIAAANTLAYLASDVPIVALEAGPEEGVSVAAVDQSTGARLATQHLLDLGHHTVHHIAGPAAFQEAHQRLSGWRETLQAAGAPIPDPVFGDWSARSGFDAAQHLLEMPDLTAVFVANDQMTLGLLRAINEHGRRVPEDISIVGFDDIPEAGYFTPPLTTIRQNFTEVGRRAIRLLLEEIDERRANQVHELVAPELITRRSTARPRTRREHRQDTAHR